MIKVGRFCAADMECPVVQISSEGVICNRLPRLASPYDSPPVSCHRMSHYLFLLPIHYLLCLSPTEWQWRPGGQLGNSYKSSSASPSTFATYLMYIVHLFSIDLESSCSFNSSHCKAYIIAYRSLAEYDVFLTTRQRQELSCCF